MTLCRIFSHHHVVLVDFLAGGLDEKTWHDGSVYHGQWWPPQSSKPVLVFHDQNERELVILRATDEVRRHEP